MAKILLIEDDAILCETLGYNLEREGFDALLANDGPSGLELARSQQPVPLSDRRQLRGQLAGPQPVWRWKRDPKGTQYLIRSSYVYDERGTKKYYVAIGLSYAESQKLLNGFTWLTMGLSPLVFLIGGITGWMQAAALAAAKTRTGAKNVQQ